MEDILFVSQPNELKATLYPHQLSSVYQMELREKVRLRTVNRNYRIETNIGINADKTGYGKTLSVVALVLRNQMEWDMETTYKEEYAKSVAGGKIIKTHFKEYDRIDCTLVVTPHSIVKQWFSEFSKTPLRVAIINNTKTLEATEVANQDVIIVSPTFFKRLMNMHTGKAWKRLVYDEPGHLKIPGIEYVTAGFYWLITATPDLISELHRRAKVGFLSSLSIQVSYRESFSQCFDYLIVKNSDEFVESSFKMPPINYVYHKCYDALSKTLDGIVTDKLKSMISAGNVQGVIQHLGGTETDNVIELVKNQKLAELAEAQGHLKASTIRKSEDSIAHWKERIERIEILMKELETRYNNVLSGDCNICFDTISKPLMEPNCQNIFCGECLLRWVQDKKSCPLCRVNVDISKLVYINKETGEKKSEDVNVEKRMTKNNIIVKLIEDFPDNKFIIFSDWDETFAPIRAVLTESNIKFVEIRGNCNIRNSRIEDFKYGDVNVIFLNSKFNGVGINLQEATDIIIYHDMSEQNLNQIKGRSLRIGRKKQLTIHNWVTSQL